MAPLPNLLFIGPNKAGSTWLYELLDWHPGAWVPAAKEIYFFDFYFDRGVDWYAAQYAKAPVDARIRADISHDYLFAPEAPKRVAEVLDEPTLMLTLREPVGRAFSEYLYMRKQGRVSGTFEEAIVTSPSILSHSRYGEHLGAWLDVFDRDRFLFTVFDDLRADSLRFSLDVFDALELDRIEPPADVLAPSLERARSRNAGVAKLATFGSTTARNLGLASLVGKVKSNDLVQRALYTSWSDPPTLDPGTEADLRTGFADDVARLDEIAGLGLSERWGY